MSLEDLKSLSFKDLPLTWRAAVEALFAQDLPGYPDPAPVNRTVLMALKRRGWAYGCRSYRNGWVQGLTPAGHIAYCEWASMKPVKTKTSAAKARKG